MREGRKHNRLLSGIGNMQGQCVVQAALRIHVDFESAWQQCAGGCKNKEGKTEMKSERQEERCILPCVSVYTLSSLPTAAAVHQTMNQTLARLPPHFAATVLVLWSETRLGQSRAHPPRFPF